MRRALGMLVGLALAGAAPAIAIADPVVRLAASAEVCDPAPLRARVVALLGRDVFVDGEQPAAATVLVGLVTGPAGIHATIALRDDAGVEHGRRVLAVADCDALIEPAALVIALVLSQPIAEAPASPAAPAPEARRPTPARRDLEPAPPLAVETAPVPRRGLGLEMIAGAAGGRAGHGLAGAIVLGAGLRHGGRSIGLDFQLAAPDSVGVGGGRVVVTTGTIELSGCVRLGPVSGCTTAAGGWVRGRGEALAAAATATMPYAAAGLRVAWDRALSERIGIQVRLGARVPITRNRFLVDDMPVWSSSIVEAWLGLGLVARIP